MTIDEQDDPVQRELKKMQGAGDDPVARELAGGGDPNAALHAEFKSGRLGKRMAAENAVTQAEENPDFGTQFLGTAASLGRHIPGMEAVQAGASALANRTSYRDALKQIKQAEEASGKSGDVAGFLGAAALTPVLPASGAATGAVLGGGEQLLNSDPDSGWKARLARAAVGAGTGAALGKATDMAIAGARTLGAKGVEAAKNAAIGERAEVATPYYRIVEQAPKQPLTPEMGAVLQDEAIAPIVADLKTLKQFQGVSDNDPKLLLAVRQVLSDSGHQLDKASQVVDPSKMNLIRFQKEHIALLKDTFDKAADTQVPGFSQAIAKFAEQSVPVSGQEAGYEAMRRKLAGGLASWKNVGKKTPGALDAYLANNPEGAAGATEGVLAATRGAFKNGQRVSSLWNATPLLQKTDATSGQAAPNLIQKALLALANASANRQ